MAFGWVLSSGLSYGWLVIKRPRSCTAKAISAGFETQHRSCMGTKPWKKTIESELRVRSWCQRATGHGELTQLKGPCAWCCQHRTGDSSQSEVPKGQHGRHSFCIFIPPKLRWLWTHLLQFCLCSSRWDPELFTWLSLKYSWSGSIPMYGAVSAVPVTGQLSGK